MKRVLLFIFTLSLAVFLVIAFSPVQKESGTDDSAVSLPKDQTSGLDTEFIIELGKATLVPDETRGELLKEWQTINEKVGLMLTITDLDVSEPVLCGVKDNKEWLRTDITGTPNVCGTVFLDYRCNLELCLTKLIHGHNMKNGTMFGPLPALLDLESCADAPILELTYAEGTAKYEVCAVLSVNSKEETLPIDIFTTVEETEEMLRDLVSRSVVPDGVIHSVDSLILNTCWYGESGVEHNLHCIVVATRI